MEYLLFVLYFSFFLCLCALVCLYFSGCQEMTYRHEGRRRCPGSVPAAGCPLPGGGLGGEAEGGWSGGGLVTLGLPLSPAVPCDRLRASSSGYPSVTGVLYTFQAFPPTVWLLGKGSQQGKTWQPEGLSPCGEKVWGGSR